MGREDWLGSEVLSRRHSSRHERILNSSSAPALVVANFVLPPRVV